MSPFALYARKLRPNGFRKDWESRAGGSRVTEWKRDEPDGRTIRVQIWDDGGHRVNHEWIGCSDTTPTPFYSVESLWIAIEHESTRLDSRYRDPRNHHTPGSREILEAKQRAAA